MKLRTTVAAILAALTHTQVAQTITITGSVGGAPTGVSYLNFDDLAEGSSGALTTSGPGGPIEIHLPGNAHVAVGSLSGRYAAPCISGANGLGFGSQIVAGQDTTPYLTSGRIADGGSITITFASDQSYFGLLWGSVDNYNKLEFFDFSGNLVATVTGSDVVASPNGDQGINGTLYVNIDDITPFRRVVASSTDFAFELDNVAYSPRPLSEVPDGGSIMSLFGLALAGLIYQTRRSGRL